MPDRLPFIVWRSDYSVGNELLDSHHRKMFEVINTLYHEIRESKFKLGVAESHIGDLVEYARVHFRAEEQIMEAHGYPELQKHREAHHKFEDKISSLRSRLIKNGDLDAHEILDFLKKWWTSHIIKRDKDYQPYIING